MTAQPAEPRHLELCSDISQQRGEDPIGTAPHWQEVTVLEVSMNIWAAVRDSKSWNAEQAQVFEGLKGKVEASGAGFGLLRSAPDTPSPLLRVRHYRLGEAGGYLRRDYQLDAPPSEWARGLRDTLLEPENLQHWQALEVPAGPDMQVCTNGTTDAACGKYGVPVYAALRAQGLRAWRTGHFGGHRFAATAVELPSGMVWAHLTPQLSVQAVRREVAPEQLRMHLRGYAGLPALAQVLDRELLMQRGWEWLDTRRWATVEGSHVTLHTAGGEVVQAQVIEREPLMVRSGSHSPKDTSAQQYTVIW